MQPPIQNDEKSFRSVVAAQALGSFNDNLFKQFLIYFGLASMATAEVLEKTAQGFEKKVELGISTTVLFILPFILFSTWAGSTADRLSKRTVIVAMKSLEVLLMLLATIGFAIGSYGFLLVVLFLMSTQSSFFSPAKYGILPEIMAPSSLARANGLLELTNFLGIILGGLVAGVSYPYWKDQSYWAGVVLCAVSVAGVIASLRVAKVPAADPARIIEWSPLKEAARGLRTVWPSRTLRLTVIGIAYFWSLALFLSTNLLFHGEHLMSLSEERVGYLLGALSVGIGTGSALAGLASKRRVELGIVPIGSLGMAVASMLLSLTWRGVFWWPGGDVASGAFWWTFANLSGLGLCGGFFIVPLQAYLQQEAPPEEKGIVVALANLAAFTGMLLALGFLWLLLGTFGLLPDQVFALVGVLTLLGTVFVFTVLPQQLVRFVLYIVTNTIYRLRIIGPENLPQTGSGLLVVNHVSFADGLLLLASTSRPIRFIVHRDIAERPLFRWLSKVMRVIPIAAEDGPRAVLGALREANRALEAGELVCIFAEGQITRTGNILPFRAGAERILKGSTAPVIPVHLDQVWGSIFSFSGRRFFWKIPIRLPYPVTISFGRHLPPDTPMSAVRLAVMELGSEAALLRRGKERALPWSFVRYARRHLFAVSMVDSSGKRLTYGKLLAGAVHLARRLSPSFRGEDVVGVLIPPSVGGAVTNLAVSLLGKTVVNLNYTASKESTRSSLEQTGVRHVVTSRAFLEKVPMEVPAELIYLEDLAASPRRCGRILDAICSWILPARLLARVMGGRMAGPEDLVTVIFSSGSTGEPKGVMLTHFNILSNIQAVTQVIELGPQDRLLGVLPFFHSTGYTAGLWAPLLTGMVVAYHSNPLDARTVGELLRRHGVTIVFATPTFLSHYTRRCDPGDFGSVKFVLAGAEKLTASGRDAFRARFGIEPMEGYGCTEASPMVAVNSPDFRGRGFYQVACRPGTVGQPLPGVSVRITDPDTGALLPVGEAGMLLVKGPNIMQGYLGKPELTAEVLQGGWYKTGDIARLDGEGFLTITDRLSRFSKIGGEMVPHLGVEEALHRVSQAEEPLFFVTSIPDEKKGERLAVIHVASDEVVAKAREALQQEGLPNLWIPKPEMYVRVEAIPRLGTGKVDLKELRRIAQATFGESA